MLHSTYLLFSVEASTVVRWLLIFKFTYDNLIIYIILARVLIATQLSNFASIWFTSQQLTVQIFWKEKKELEILFCNAII